MTATSERTNAVATTNFRTRHSRSSRTRQPLRSLGKWQLCKLAGCGAFTDVFLAKPRGCPPNWPADYAVKMLRREHASDSLAIELLRREAEAASGVAHQHLVTILEAHLRTAEKYLVMPRLEGVSIGQVLERAGYLSVRQSLWIVRQVSEALRALHEQGWLHGDVKPDNIMFSAQGHATLVDLGFASRFAESMITEARVARGTFAFLAPETMTSAFVSDPRSDIYSLGITLYTMLTGQLPFSGQNASELIEAHRGRPVPDPRAIRRDIPSTVVRLISRMTAKQPLRRPQNAAELVEEILPLELAAIHADRAVA